MPIISSLSFWPPHSKLTWCSSIPLICIQCSSSWSRTWCSSPSWALSSFSLSRSPTLLLHSSSCPSSHRPTCTKAFSVFSLFWERLNGTRGLLFLRKCHFLSLIPFLIPHSNFCAHLSHPACPPHQPPPPSQQQSNNLQPKPGDPANVRKKGKPSISVSDQKLCQTLSSNLLLRWRIVSTLPGAL